MYNVAFRFVVFCFLNHHFIRFIVIAILFSKMKNHNWTLWNANGDKLKIFYLFSVFASTNHKIDFFVILILMAKERFLRLGDKKMKSTFYILSFHRNNFGGTLTTFHLDLDFIFSYNCLLFTFFCILTLSYHLFISSGRCLCRHISFQYYYKCIINRYICHFINVGLMYMIRMHFHFTSLFGLISSSSSE